MFRTIRATVWISLISAASCLASPNGGFVVDFNEDLEQLNLLRVFGDAEIRSEGGLVIGPNGETSGYLQLGSSIEASTGAVVFDGTQVHDEDADLFRLKFEIQNPKDAESTTAASFSIFSPDDPLISRSSELTEATWEEHFSATSLTGTSMPLLSTNTGVSVGLALTTNDVEQTADKSRPCPGHLGQCLTVDLRLDGELIAAAEQPVSDEPWLTIAISSAPTSILRRHNSVVISEELTGDILKAEVPYLKGLTNAAITSTSAPGSVGYAIDDVWLLHGGIFPESGDFNEDGLIDFHDFLILTHYMNTSPATYAQGDFDFSGRVDLADFVGFRRAWELQLLGVSAVPEPGFHAISVTLLCLALSLSRTPRRVRRGGNNDGYRADIPQIPQQTFPQSFEC